MALSSCNTSSKVEPRNDKFFVKFFDGRGIGGNQEGRDVIATSDGGYLLAGVDREDNGNTEFLVVKTDIMGNQLWKLAEFDSTQEISGEAKSILEVTDGYIIGGTTMIGGIEHSVLLKLGLDGSRIDTALIYTDNNFNRLSKITSGNSGILISGETDHINSTAGGLNGFLRLYDESLNVIKVQSKDIWYFGLGGDDFVSGAFEVNDPNLIGSDAIQYLVFGHFDDVLNSDGFDFYYNGFDSNFTPANSLTSNSFKRSGDQLNSDIVRFNNLFYMIGTTTANGSQLFLSVLAFDDKPVDDDWQFDDPRSGPIPTNTDIAGKSLVIPSPNKIILTGDIIFSNDHSEIYLGETNANKSVEWARTFGTLSQYKAGGITIDANGSIIVVGSADLESQTKMILIKTGPDGKMSL